MVRGVSGRTQSSASRVLAYSNMFWQEAIMEGYKVNKSGEGQLDRAIWLLGTNMATYIVHLHWHNLSHDCLPGMRS